MHVSVDGSDHPNTHTIRGFPLLHGLLLDQHGNAGSHGRRSDSLFQAEPYRSKECLCLLVTDIDSIRALSRNLFPSTTCVSSTIKWATFGIIWLKAILLLAAPFVVAGIAVSLALTRSSFPVGITYGVDLLGAAVGCLVTLAVLQWMDAASAMFLVAALAAAAGWFFASTSSEPVPDDSVFNSKVLGKPGVIAIALTSLACANSLVNLGLQPVAAKFGRIERLDSFDYVKWNSFSRVAVNRPHAEPPILWGPSPTLPANAVVEQRIMNIDGFAGTTMPEYSNAPGAMDFLRYDITNLAYYARHKGRSAVIGVGSGRDVLSASLFGFRDITGVELNPVFIDPLTDPKKLRSYAGVADLPGVHFV
jgi:hypothetical protein